MPTAPRDPTAPMPRPAPMRHGKVPSSRPVRVILRIVLAVIAVAAVSATSIAAIAAWDVARSFKPSVTLVHSAGATPPTIGALEGGVNFLVTGDDSGDGDPQYGHRGEKLNDVTMLIHLSSDHTNATIVTFPRDMRVRISQCPMAGGKVSGTSVLPMNNAFTYGGLPCVAKVVEDLTGLTISYAANVGFDGAVKIAGIIGGVRVCVAEPIVDRYSGLNLPAGEQTISGSQAVAFLRSRHGIGDGSDLGRISNQQLFFSAMVRQTRSQLSNLPQLYQIAKVAASSMTLTSNLENLNTLVSIALAFKDIDFDKIVFVQYPNHYATGPDGKSQVVVTEDAAQVLDGALQADRPVLLTGTVSGQQQSTQVDPNAPSASPPTSARPDPSNSADAPVPLPATVTGQTAAEQTCTRAYHF